MAQPPSNKQLVISVVATLGCLLVIYLALVLGGPPRAAPDAGNPSAPGRLPAQARGATSLDGSRVGD